MKEANPRRDRLRVSTFLVLVGSMVAGDAARGAAPTFSDGSFADADWSHFLLYHEDTSAGNTGTASFDSFQSLTGGDPGAFQQGSHTWTPLEIRVGHLSGASVYDPSVSGAIVSVDFSRSLKVLAADPVLGGAMAGAGPLIEQDGQFFLSGAPAASLGADWSTTESNLSEVNFRLVIDTLDMEGEDPNVHPDFSETGAPSPLAISPGTRPTWRPVA